MYWFSNIHNCLWKIVSLLQMDNCLHWHFFNCKALARSRDQPLPSAHEYVLSIHLLSKRSKQLQLKHIEHNRKISHSYPRILKLSKRKYGGLVVRIHGSDTDLLHNIGKVTWTQVFNSLNLGALVKTPSVWFYLHWVLWACNWGHNWLLTFSQHC